MWKRGINRTVNEHTEDVRLLVKGKLWGEQNFMDWKTIGELYGFSKSTVYRIRYKVMESFAKNIGYI